MFKNFFFSFKILMVLCWVAGMFATGNFKSFLWALPAGYAIGTIFSEWFVLRDDDEDDLPFSVKGFGIKGRGKPIKIFDSRDKNVPAEVKETMEKLLKVMKENGTIPDEKKCNDPHCPACYGLAEGDEKKI